jgi:hypothetical protein
MQQPDDTPASSLSRTLRHLLRALRSSQPYEPIENEEEDDEADTSSSFTSGESSSSQPGSSGDEQDEELDTSAGNINSMDVVDSFDSVQIRQPTSISGRVVASGPIACTLTRIQRQRSLPSSFHTSFETLASHYTSQHVQILFPGERVPLRVTNAADQELLQKHMQGDLVNHIGVVAILDGHRRADYGMSRAACERCA